MKIENNTYEIEIIRSIQELNTVKPIWNEIIKDNNNVCLTLEWISCWLKCFMDKNNSLKTIIIKKHNKPVAIAPFVIKKIKFLFFNFKVIEFVSMADYPDSPTNICPELDFIISSDAYQLIDKIFEEVIKEEWQFIRLHPIPKESKTIPELKDFTNKHNYKFFEREAFKSLIINTGKSWEDYTRSLSKRFRKQLRYYQNKFREIGELQFILFKSPAEINENLHHVLDIEKRSWKWQKGVSINSISYKNFFKEFPEQASHFEWVHLWLLKLNGEYIAYDLNICYKDKVINWKGSYDDRYSNFGPGQLLLEKELEFYIKNKTSEFNMLWGQTLAKERWNPENKSFSEIFIFKRTSYSTLLRILLINLNLYKINRIFQNYKKRIFRKLHIRSKKSELTRADQLNISTNDLKW